MTSHIVNTFHRLPILDYYQLTVTKPQTPSSTNRDTLSMYNSLNNSFNIFTIEHFGLKACRGF
jgi:hypothetical protein